MIEKTNKQNNVSKELTERERWAFNILSDAQELIDLEMPKSASEKINDAKRVLLGRYEVINDGFSIKINREAK